MPFVLFLYFYINIRAYREAGCAKGIPCIPTYPVLICNRLTVKGSFNKKNYLKEEYDTSDVDILAYYCDILAIHTSIQVVKDMSRSLFWGGVCDRQ